MAKEEVSGNHESEFELAAKAYIETFGQIPYGLQYPDLTTELLLNAVKTGKKIRAFRLPKGYVA